ncbi:hypothetical protein [Arthrobacter sp. LFS091]|uniref:hypothetical protein n=1 Tax=Arthrobacter sp. LFS091 TaxID=3229892 RepID=UPI003A80DEF3
MKIIVIVALSVVAAILTVLGIIWSNKPRLTKHPKEEGFFVVETPDNAWQAHRGTAFGIGGAALGFSATMIALFVG